MPAHQVLEDKPNRKKRGLLEVEAQRQTAELLGKDADCKQSKIEAFWARTKSWTPMAGAHSTVAEHRENVDEALRHARQQSQLDGRAERRASEEKVASLVAFEKSVGSQHVEALASVCPSLKGLIPCLTLVPAPFRICLEMSPMVFHDATQGAAWAQMSRLTNVGAALGKE